LRLETVAQLALVGFFVLLAVAEVLLPWPRPFHARGRDTRLITNFGLTAMILLAGGLFPLARLVSSFAAQRLGVGVANVTHLPWAIIFAATFLLDSFAAYWAHRLMHATPLLWRVHRVHHADSEVDVSTSFRNHPLELLVTVPASAAVVLLLGAPLTVIVAVQTAIMAAAMWQHADINLPARLDRQLSRIIVTPRLHRLHHCRERQIHDSNFGDSIVLWDYLFGTLTLIEERRAVGLEGQRARADHLLEQFWSPIHAA
jgi:sterol desaturase/sphingolipid hydroxylase (fatty acid hydroxylase superfamily)